MVNFEPVICAAAAHRLVIDNAMWDGDHVTTVPVHGTNACIMHTEDDVINNLPHPLMMMNLIILHK